ncbi:MAG TPA: glycosyltransferase [Baekduia sp.]|nr:glycosyltransferase [Baekduia sp.]
MPVRADLPDRPEIPVAVVLAVHDRDAVARCLVSLLPALPTDVPLLAAGAQEGLRAVEELCGERVVVGLGTDIVAGWNAAAQRFPDAALVLVDDATEVGPSFLEDLLAVVAAEPDAATVTPLSNSAAFLSAPRRNLAWPLLPPALTAADAAVRVHDASLGLHPRTPTALAHLALVTAPARALVGGFDAALAPREALADFCARATAAGLAHVVADEVYVGHRGDGEAPAAERDPGLAAAIDEAANDRHSRLARALLAASVVLEPLRVTVDARPLSGGVTGTTIHLVELIGALAARDDVHVRALLPERVGDEAAAALSEMGGAVEAVTAGTPWEQLGRTHVVHRPWQVESAQEMAQLDRLGERTIVTNQDLIGYRTPSVFESPARWRDYRQATRDALGLAAMVLFFSQTAADDALADDLVAPDRARVVALGARNEHLALAPAAAAPAGLATDGDRPFLLVLGTRYRHKNVRFALELLAALRAEQGWDGDLVIAGAEVLHGSGGGDDAAWLLGHPEHARHVHTVGAVTEPEKAWLLGTAAAVVYPSTYEGFGLIPFEAAAAGTPCLAAPTSALRDTLPAELSLLVPWDASASAARAVGVLTPGAARDALVDGLRGAAAPLTWSATGAALVDAYRAAIRLPAPATARLADDLARAEHDYWSARDGIQDGAWRLVRPDDPLIDEGLALRLGGVLGQAGGRERLLGSLPDRPSLAARAAGRLRGSASKLGGDE